MGRHYSIDDIRRIAVPIAQQYGVKKLALFGSYARGEQRQESDIDLIMDKGRIEGWEYYGFINHLEDSFGLHVDVLTYDALSSSLLADAPIHEVVLYETQ